MARGGTIRVGGVRVDASMETATIEKNIAQINSRLDSFARNTRSILTGIGAGISLRGIEGFVSGVIDLAKAGHRLGDLQGAFRDLGGSLSWIDTAKERINGVASSMDLLTQGNRMLAAGFRPTQEQFAKLADLAARYGEATDQEAVPALEKLTTAILKGSASRLNLLGFHVDGKTLAEKHAQVLAQLPTVLEKYAPIAKDASSSASALAAAWEEAKAKFGQAANENETLIRGLAELRSQINSVDFSRLMSNLASLAGVIVGTTAKILEMAKALDGWGTSAGDAWGRWITDADEKRIEAADKSLQSFSKSLQIAQSGGSEKAIGALAKNFLDISSSISKAGLGDKFDSQLQAIQNQFLSTAAGANALKAATDGVKESAKPPPPGKTLPAAIGGDADGAASALSKLQAKLGEMRTRQLQGRMGAAIQAGDFALVEQLKPVYEQAIYEGQMAGLAEYVKRAGPMGEQLATQIATAETQAKMEDINGQIKDGLLAIHGEAVDFWTNAFENAITGETFNLEDMFTQLAIGFAAELAAQVSEAMLGVDFLKGITSLKDAGGTLAQFLLGGNGGITTLLTGGGNGGLLGGSGILSGAIGGFAGAAGGLTGVGGGFMAGLTGTAIAPTSAAASTAMSAGATVAAAAPYVAAAIGAYMIADKTGMVDGIMASLGHGKTSAEELSRREFSSWITEKFNKLNTAAFMGPDGRMVLGGAQGFQFDVSDKDIKRAQGYFAELGAEAQNTFNALGTAFNRLAGLTEEQSAQIAAALSEDLLGNIDNARLLVYQLGLSFEELAGAIFEAAKAGEIRWSEYNAQIAGLKDAFEPGLKAVGDYGQAFQNLIDSGGRGMAALKAVQDTAVEGMEAGMTTVDQLGQALKEKGLDPEWVDAYVGAIKAKGITTLEELKNADQEVMGSIVGNMEQASDKLSQSWQKMGEGIDELAAKMDAFAERENIEKFITVTAKLNDPDNLLGGGGGGTQGKNNDGTIDGDGDPTTPMARGGLVMRPMRALIGEAGPEVVIPLRDVNKGLLNSIMGGAGGGQLRQTVYNIDARGAQRGVSSEIMAALRAAENRAVERSVYAVIDGQQRGRF